MGQEHVLVVDDDADIRAFVALELGLHGYRVVDADSGQAAIDIIDRESSAVTLLDIRMPGLSGLDEVVASVRAAHHRPVA
jgi:two-component system KDP operon response regulator KdpE